MTAQQLDLVNALKATNARIRDLTEVAEHLKTQIIAELGDTEELTDTNGHRILTYRQSRTFSIDRAADYIPAHTIAACTKPDPAKVKKLLTGDQLDACMVPGPRRFILAD